MRTTEAARYARWSAAVAMLLAVTVGGIYVSRAWQARHAQRAARSSVPPTVHEQTAEFSLSKVTGDRTEFTVRASHATEFTEGGRSVLEDVWVTAYGQDGQRFDNLHTHACDYVASTGNITCAGDVQIDLQSAADAHLHPNTAAHADPGARVVHVSTSHVSFNRETGVATTDQPVALDFPQGEGRGIGFRYDAAKGELVLARSVEMTFRGAEGPAGAAADALELASGGLLYSRDAQVIHFLGPVAAHRGSQELAAGKLDVELDAELRARRIVASDHPVLRDAGGNEPASLSADELSAVLSAHASIERILGVGNVHVDAHGASGADRLEAGRAELDLAAPTSELRRLTASENVTAESTRAGGVKQRLATTSLKVEFAAEGKRGQVRVGRAATPAATVDWEGPAGVADRTQTQRTRLTSQRLEATFTDLNQIRELRGAGGVKIERQIGAAPPETSTSQDVVARFSRTGDWSSMDQSGDVTLREADRTARGASAHFDRLTESIALGGSVALADPDSNTTAQSATFRQTAGEFQAEGRVVTSEIVSGPRRVADFAPGPARITADGLIVNSKTGHAVYSGRARLWQGDSVIEADTIELDRATRVLTATSRVHAIFPQARWMPSTGPPAARQAAGRNEYWRAEAGRMTYASNEGRGRLEQGVSAHSEEGAIRSDSMDLFFAPAEASLEGPAGTVVVQPAGVVSGTGASQQLVRATALGRVAVDQQGRRGTAARADYTAAEGKFVLSGGPPAIHDDSGNSVTGRQLTLFFADDRIAVDSAEGLRTLTLHRVEK